MSVGVCGRCPKGPPNANLVPKIGTAAITTIGHLLIRHSFRPNRRTTDRNQTQLLKKYRLFSTINRDFQGSFFSMAATLHFLWEMGMWPFSIQRFFVEFVDPTVVVALIVIFHAPRLPSVSGQGFFLKKSVRQETLNLSFFRDQHFGFKFHSKNAKQAHGVAPIVALKDQINCPMSHWWFETFTDEIFAWKVSQRRLKIIKIGVRSSTWSSAPLPNVSGNEGNFVFQPPFPVWKMSL